ncbi:hypothetical protein DL768_001767 [Monosporascus sp. mg162]|nr:hypothetical protein DL768_001767 [Monosporascus sp. mg162]
MAILEELPGVKVTVRVEGKDCVEYEDPDAADIQTSRPTSSKYIESVDDAEFCVHFHMDSNYNWDYREHCLVVAVYADNQWLNSSFVEKTALINGQLDIDVDRLNKVDDTTKARIEEDRKVAKNLGIITVRLKRVIKLDSYDASSSAPVKSTSLDLTEKSFKGKEISHEALKREMIIPRTPTQSPALQDDFDTLSDAEKARLARERFQELQSIKKIKKEELVTKRGFSEVFDLADDGLRSRPTKRTAQVIDLTDD